MMILGVGVDLVDVQRVGRLISSPGFVGRFFHPQEAEYATTKKAGYEESLAACLAAKEAFGKALGTGLKGFQLKEIEVTHDASGRPFLRLHGRAAETFKRFGGSRIHLSLSHERSLACGFVLIEGEGKDTTDVEDPNGRGIGE